MKDISHRQGKILQILAQNGERSSSGVFSALTEAGEEISLVTVKRDLSTLLDKGYIRQKGRGRATSYELRLYGRFFTPINAEEYTDVPVNKRGGNNRYNFKALRNIDFNLFSNKEYALFEEASKKYQKRKGTASKTIHEKEVERFIIELSWKSSKIEGNTYSLLDTEQIIKNNLPAEGHTNEEATMILNHKKTLDFILQQKNKFKGDINRALIDEVHKRIVDGLSVGKGLRNSPVGITGTAYRPPDNKHQIEEALVDFCNTVNRASHSYDKALLALLGISYIQPFEDGSKRTARLLANALLLAQGLAPLSYRNTDEDTYKKATLVFYEVNSIMPMKKIFFEQYLFSSENYTV